MRVLIVALLLSGCTHEVVQDETQQQRCQRECQEKFGTDVNFYWVFTGDCACKKKQSSQDGDK
jgi:hypothetical protein